MYKILILLLFAPFFVSYSQDSDSLIVEKYLILSRENERKNPILTSFYINKIISYSENNNYQEGLFIAKKEKAFLYYINKKYDSALFLLRYDSFKEQNITKKNKARLYNLKGVIFQGKGITDSSLFYLNKSLNIYKSFNDSEGIISSLSNIGISLYNSGLINEALLNFKDAYELCLKFKNYKNLVSITNNYASLLVNNEETEKAKKLFISLLENKDLERNPIQKASILLNWASYLKLTGKPKEAFKWYQKALEYSKNKKAPISPNIYIGLGQIYLSENKPSKALLEFKKILNLNLTYTEKKMTFKGITDSYSKLKIQDSLMFYWKKTNQLIEENSKKEVLDAIAQAQKNVVSYKKDIDIELLVKDNNILNQKNRANKFVILSLILLILMVFSFVYWYKKQQKLKNKQLLKEMEIKKQGLVTYALKITQKNKLLYDLKERINELEPKENIHVLAIKKEITSTIIQSVNRDKDWKQFEVYFNDVYQGFYKRLKEQYPNLTDNDLRVCSMVKLRFTIKEISNLLFLSVETIKSTRYRIRKKLYLQQEQNLADFLNEIYKSG